MDPLAGKKVVLVVASSNFRDEELTWPYSELTAAGAVVTVASSKPGQAKGMMGKLVDVATRIEDLVATNFDAVVFVGGAGAEEFYHSLAAHRLAREAVEGRKILGAICVAPVVLANAGVLKGRKATGFPSIRPILVKAGCIVVEQPVVRDGLLLTADGPQSANAFAKRLVEVLKESR